MAEMMQAARRSSSSCPSLFDRLSIERPEMEELSKLLFTFGSKISPPVARSAGSVDPVEDPELADLPSADGLGRRD